MASNVWHSLYGANTATTTRDIWYEDRKQVRTELLYVLLQQKHCLMRCPVWMGGEESVDEADLERYEQTKGYAD